MRTLATLLVLFALVAFSSTDQPNTPPIVSNVMLEQWNARDRNLMQGEQVSPSEAWNMGAYAVRDVYETMIQRGELIRATDCK